MKNRRAHGVTLLARYHGQIIVVEHVRTFDLPEYRGWSAMWRRCMNKNYRGYAYHGGRGITVCDRWKSFPDFYLDMGPRPTPKHTIDRINNDGNYEPTNCRWATVAQQAVNKRNTVYVEYEGRRQPLRELVRRFNVPNIIARARLFKMGWTLEEALNTPIRPCKQGKDRKKHKKQKLRIKKSALDNPTII